MERASIGGRANWAGAAFELRLGVEFCVYIMVGEAAGLGPGAARQVQLQAPEPVDDLVLEFETGARWAIQAKAGPSVRVEWNPKRPFGKALRQLYHGVTSGQIDLAPESLDRVELAVDHRAPPSITAFGDWLTKARQHHDWDGFVAASTGPEREWAQRLPALLEPELETEPGDDLLRFLRQLYVRRAPQPDAWRSDLRGRLIVAGVPDSNTADRVLDVLLAQVAAAAPRAGQLDCDDLRRACAGISGLPRPGAPAFRLFRNFAEDDLYRALRMPPTRPNRFVERPELADVLDSGAGLLVTGRPGSGKSHALIKLALARPDWPMVVVARSFRSDDLSRLTAQLRRVHSPYQLLWDDVHEKPALFADAVLRLAEMGDPSTGLRAGMRVLAAYREQHTAAVRERVTPGLCRRAGIQPQLPAAGAFRCRSGGPDGPGGDRAARP
ncbi:MAG: ATP-binding protein, partial [Dehalococcoidia bacterium]